MKYRRTARAAALTAQRCRRSTRAEKRLEAKNPDYDILSLKATLVFSVN